MIFILLIPEDPYLHRSGVVCLSGNSKGIVVPLAKPMFYEHYDQQTYICFGLYPLLVAVSLSRFPIGSGICDIPYRLCTCGKYLPIPGCIRRLLAVPAVSSLGSPVKDTDSRWCYISTRPVYQVPFNVRKRRHKCCRHNQVFCEVPCVGLFHLLPSCCYTFKFSTQIYIFVFTI